MVFVVRAEALVTAVLGNKPRSVSSWRKVLMPCLLGAVTLMASAVGAEPNGEPAAPACAGTPAECGRAAFAAGVMAYEAEDYELALRHFRSAQSLKAHPVVLYNVALAEAKLGFFLEAAAHVREVYADPATPDGMLPEVSALRDQVEAKVALITVEDSEAVLTVDGERADGDPPSARVNPGAHRIRVEIDGEIVSEREAVVVPGERLRLAITAPRHPPPAPASPTPRPPAVVTAEPEVRAAAPRPRSPLRSWVLVSGGATAGLGVASLASGLDTRRAFREFEGDVSGLTEAERQDRVEDGERRELRTNVLLGLTGVVALTTGVLVVVSLRPRARTQRMSLLISPGMAAVMGRF
ncbi:MAG: hypothetical protein JW751_16825 [Polyangiaceae bacterium]|nr:hypothetical protein [Polyangiaceae bacterium]